MQSIATRTGTVASDVKRHQVFLQRERVCVWALGKQHPRFFEESIFLYAAAAGLLLPPRACAPPLLRAYTSVSIFQMVLATKFKMVAKCQQTKITSLNINTPHPIERAERVVTKYGDAILVTLLAPETFLKVFLPRRYGTLWRR